MSDDRGDRSNVIRLFGDGNDGEAIKRWADRLDVYLDDRALVEHVREQKMPEPPWPGTENPMAAYLVDRGREILQSEGADAALIWLAVHAWFEGAVDERYRAVSAVLGDASTKR
jgi:hypothetical protein